MLVLFITGHNEVVAKVIFLHLFVILFTGGGGGLPQCMLGYHPQSRQPPREQTPGSRHPLGADTTPGPDTLALGPDPPGADPPGGGRLQHTVYERPVSILLECILVSNGTPKMKSAILAFLYCAEFVKTSSVAVEIHQMLNLGPGTCQASQKFHFLHKWTLPRLALISS